MSITAQETHVRDIPGIKHAEATALAVDQYEKLLTTLRGLTEEEWNAPTDCDRWTVRDIIAHMMGWAEATLSPRELVRQIRVSRKRSDELGGGLNAQNELQVEERRDLSTDELLRQFEAIVPRFVKRRRLFARTARFVPYYSPELKVTNLGFVMNVIFTRDTFMHRVDITRATNKELELGASERRIAADAAKQWARDSGAVARIKLTGPAGGDYLSGDNPAATVTGDAVEFCRMLTGRADKTVMAAEGDERAATRWLETPVMF